MTARRTLAFVIPMGFALVFTALPVSAMAPQGTLVKVPLDVDVYDQPGGESKKRPGFLAGGTEVILLEKRADDWCNVQFDKGGTGWIWCGMGDDGQNYSLTPVAADAPEPTEPGGGGGGGAGGGGPTGE
jgi:hypothetical protein